MNDHSNRNQTRATYAHENLDLRRDNPLYERAGPVRDEFERDDPERTARREAFMVKRQQPKPVLRPTLSLSADSDRASFNNEWEQERRSALRDAYKLRENLLGARLQLRGLEDRREQAAASGSMRDLDQTERDLDRLQQRAKASVRSFTRAHGKF